jgi:hypothetical protein
MGGIVSKDTLNKIDKYVDIPPECNNIEPEVQEKVNESINEIQNRLTGMYLPQLNNTGTQVVSYLNVLKYAGIVYFILFILMMLIQLLIIILLARSKQC